MATSIRRASANVFADLGFRADMAEHLRLRSDLMIELTRHIKSRNLTQAQAALLLGVSQPRISDLTRGKIDRFSVDTLIEMMGRAGFTVALSTKRRRTARV